MKTTELRSAVMALLADPTSAHGFKVVERESMFVREPCDGWKEGFGIRFLQYPPTHLMESSAWIRINEVEEIFHGAIESPANIRRRSWTFAVEISRLQGRNTWGDTEPTVEFESDVPRAAKGLSCGFANVALPFFARVPDLDAANSLVNSKPAEHLHEISGWLERSSVGLILAHLNGDPRFDELLRIYTKVMKSKHNRFYLPQFDAVVAALAKLRAGSGPAVAKRSVRPKGETRLVGPQQALKTPAKPGKGARSAKKAHVERKEKSIQRKKRSGP